MDPKGPQKFGRFCLLRRIALGGMAEIFLAAERRLDDTGGPRERTLVIKRILPHYAESPEFVAYFVNEGSIATRLHHPNMIETYELGQIENQYYLAMEYVKGASLLDVLLRSIAERRPLPLGFAVDVVLAAAQGLAYVHAAVDDRGRPLGIVHRDVSPHNILLGFDGSVKVMDFGIAKAATQLHHTKTGTIKGKLSYVAPEQVSGGVVDGRTDVFALGIVLHEAIAGKQLFKGQNEAETLAKALKSPIPPLAAVRPDCPPELERIALRALARNAAERYPSAQAMADELAKVRPVLTDPPDVVATYVSLLFPDELMREDPRPPTSSWLSGEVMSQSARTGRRGRWASGALMAAAALGVVGLLTWEQRRRAHPPVEPVAASIPAAPRVEPPLPPPEPPVALAPLASSPLVPPSSDKPARHTGRTHGLGGHAVAPSPASAAAPGRLRLIVAPWAEVTIDGKVVGMTPSPPFSLPAGSHLVTLKNGELGREVKRRVTVPAGGETVLRVSLF